MKYSSKDRPLRVLYITPGGVEGRGGMGMMARYLVEAYKAADDLIAGSSIKCRVLDSYGPGSFFLMPFYFFRTSLDLLWSCLTRRVDVVHIHMSHSGSVVRKLLLLRLAHRFGVPTILHIHGSTFQVFCDRLSPFPRSLLVSSIRKATRVVVIGSFWERYLVDQIGVDAAKVVTAHNGVPMPPERPLRPIDRPRRIVALGALGQRKGTSDLLQALATPALRELDWQAVIAGNGAVDQYRAESAALGLEDRVEMPGWVGPEAAQSLLVSADIFTLPSYNEGLPVSVLEAMAAGLPVVTTPVGAIPDLVIADETGILVAPGDIDALASALYTLLTEPETRARLGAHGRARISESFTIEATAKKLGNLYREVSTA